MSDPTPTPGWTPRNFTREDLGAASIEELSAVRKALEAERVAVRWLLRIIEAGEFPKADSIEVAAWWGQHLAWREHETGINLILVLAEETRRRLAAASEVRA